MSDPHRGAAGEQIGVFGGTFDPIHLGHLEAASAVRGDLDLDRMLLVVANEPWQKAGERAVTPAEDRFAMVEAAVADRPGLEASRIEIDRGGPSYTIDTVEALRGRYPDARLTLVVGSDIASDLDTWHDAEALRGEVTVAVVLRPGAPAGHVPPGWRAVTVPVPPFDVSSTELRQCIGKGLPVGHLVPDTVVRCIHRRGLYATRR